MYLSPHPRWLRLLSVLRSKAVVLLLLTCCLLLLQLWESVIVLFFVVRSFMTILVLAIILMGKRELVALLSLSSWCLVIVMWDLPRSVMGLSAVCDCGIS